jgi:hypothetical protein
LTEKATDRAVYLHGYDGSRCVEGRNLDAAQTGFDMAAKSAPGTGAGEVH